MDVHDLARAMFCIRWEFVPEGEEWGLIAAWYGWPEERGAAIDTATELWPIIAAHVAAAVEAERAACERLALDWSDSVTIHYYDAEDAAVAVAQAIAARKGGAE